jgi:exopolysaccharide production protein ExoZ
MSKLVRLPQTESERIIGLDYLRGVCAILVMLYHIRWEFYGPFPATDFLARMGIYAVAMFFVLSGISISISYSSRMASFRDAIVFFVRRFFRLSPLYTFLITVTLLIGLCESKYLGTAWGRPRFIEMVANISMLFALMKQPYLLGGGWSLGAEVAYYLLYPLIAFAYIRSKHMFYGLLALLLIGSFGFGLSKLSSSMSLDDQWGVYINPVTNLPLFVMGVYIGTVVRYVQSSRWIALALVVGVLGFVLYPSGANSISLVTDSNRIVFCGFSTLVVLGSVVCPKMKLHFLHLCLDWLASITYSVYLVHLIVLGFVVRTDVQGILGREVSFSLVIVLSLVVASALYKFIELPGQHIGRIIANTVKLRLLAVD